MNRELFQVLKFCKKYLGKKKKKSQIMEGYCESFWTSHKGSAHNMQHKFSLKH